MDVAGTAVGVVSLGIKVCKGLIDYYQSYRNCRKDIAQMLSSVESLLGVLRNIEDVVTAETRRSGPGPFTDSVAAQILRCKKAIDNLSAELEKFKDSEQPKNLKAQIKSKARAFLYPFKEGTMRDLEVLVSLAQDALNPAIGALNLKATDRTQHELEDIHKLLLEKNLRAERGGVRSWMAGVDPNNDLYSAREKWEPGTGEWFVRGKPFSNWKSNANSLLWLHGFGTVQFLLFSQREITDIALFSWLRKDRP